MDILRQIKIEYELSNIHWIQENNIFQSEFGKRRVRIWKNKQLLKWHINLRDELSKQSGFLLDRMIRSKTGEPFIICEKGLVSIHDDIEEKFPSNGYEKVWGKLLGAILNYGSDHSANVPDIAVNDHINFMKVKENIEKLPLHDPMIKLVLKRSYYEAKKRISSAEKLTNHIHQKKLPILPSFSSISNAKQIFHYLFLECGEANPVIGYHSFRNLLEEWYIKNGERSLEKLLEEINQYFSLKGEQGLLLLSEFLMPYELQKVASDLNNCQCEEDKSNVVDDYFKRWETSRKLVQFLSNWIEKSTEKVVAT